MTAAEFAALVKRFGDAATAGDGNALAALFTPDGVYHDYIYGPHKGHGFLSRTCSRTCSIATPATIIGNSAIPS